MKDGPPPHEKASRSPQSPIDLGGAAKATLPPLSFHYRQAPAAIWNTGYTLQLDCPDAGFVELEGTRYALQQVHWHAPAEHADQGRLHPMETHLVHVSNDNEVLVVAIHLALGPENRALRLPWAHLGLKASESPVDAGPWDPNDILPRRRQAVRYTGSLTMPPFDGPVRWHVLRRVGTISQGQLEAWQRHVPPNNRPLQPPEGRIPQLDPP